MENNIDLKELSIILGLKENSSELNQFISDKKELTFIEAISNILYSDNLNDLAEKTDSNNGNNEMIDNFIKRAEIEGVGPVKLELYNNSNFIENIKGNDRILSTPKINYTQKYLNKIQKEFIKEENIIIPPVEIIQKKIENHEDNRKKFKNKNNTRKGKEKEQNHKNKDENIEIQVEKENDFEEKHEDSKEVKEKIENEKTDDQNKGNEEIEMNQDKNNNTMNQQRNNRKNYNKKYNKNKGHKVYRQNYNSKKYK